MIGTYVLSHGYYDAYYLQAQKLRRMIADDFRTCFERCDVIAGPVAPTVAWPLGAQSDDPVANYLADIFTLPASLAGLPGMSVPAGFGAGGMPVGLQLIGNYFAEGTLLHAAHAFQQATDWHARTPPREASTDEWRGRLSRRGAGARLRGRDRHRDPRPALDAIEDLQRRVDRVRRRAEHQASAVDLALPGTLPVANRGAVERAIRFGLAVGARIAPVSIFARKNYFYPDLPKGYQISQYETPVVQGGAVEFFVGDDAPPGPADARPPRGRRRQVDPRRRRRRGRARAPRRLPWRLVGHRPEPRRHAAARDRHRARHALERRGGRVRARAAHARRLARHLRRQHAGRKLSLRRQRLGAPAGRAVRHAARDQEPEQLSLHAAGDRLRGAVADRPDRGRRQRPAGDRAVRRRARRDAGDAQQGRRARLPLLPRPRPAAAGDRRRVDRARSRGDARAAARARRALPARLRARRLRRGDDDAEPVDRGLLRGGRAARARSPSSPPTGSWARSRGA